MLARKFWRTRFSSCGSPAWFTQSTRRSRRSWLLLPVMILWANLHGSFSFGLGIAIAFGAEAVFCSDVEERPRAASLWMVFLVCRFGVACVTPYGYRSLLVTLQVFGGNEALSHIGEWRPVTLQSLGLNEFFLLALLFLALFSGLRVPAWRLLMVIGITYLMFAHIRFASLFATLTPILACQSYDEAVSVPRLESSAHQPARIFSDDEPNVACGSLSSVRTHRSRLFLFGAYGPPISPRPDITPAAAVDYMVAMNLTEQRLYNEYDFGGYLIFRNIKTFIDGRSDQLFLQGFTDHLFDLLEHRPRQFVPFLAEHGVTLALVAPGSTESQELAASSKWENIYADKLAELYR